MTEKVKRRLTTVLCADVEGYSRLMEADEAGTLARLQRHRAAMTALIERHDGRVVNTWGDAVIAEFASVLEAVQCAVEIQREASDQDGDLPEAQRMRFRIGINLGDVMVDGADIYGEGVNIAARLQELAEPGGILISGPVYDQVRCKLAIAFECLGRREVKNVSTPVMSYRVMLGGAAAEAGGETGSLARHPKPEAAKQTRSVWSWFVRVPRPVAAVLVIGCFLFAINVFSGMRSVWFHWPVAAMLFVVALRAVLRSKPAQDGKGRMN